MKQVSSRYTCFVVVTMGGHTYKGKRFRPSCRVEGVSVCAGTFESDYFIQKALGEKRFIQKSTKKTPYNKNSEAEKPWKVNHQNSSNGYGKATRPRPANYKVDNIKNVGYMIQQSKGSSLGGLFSVSFKGNSEDSKSVGVRMQTTTKGKKDRDTMSISSSEQSQEKKVYTKGKQRKKNNLNSFTFGSGASSGRGKSSRGQASITLFDDDIEAEVHYSQSEHPSEAALTSKEMQLIARMEAEEAEFHKQIEEATQLSLREYQKLTAVRRAKNCNFLEYAYIFDDQARANSWSSVEVEPELEWTSTPVSTESSKIDSVAADKGVEVDMVNMNNNMDEEVDVKAKDNEYIVVEEANAVVDEDGFTLV